MGAIRKDRFVSKLVAANNDKGTGNSYTGYRFKSPLKAALFSSSIIPQATLLNTTINEEAALKIYDQLRDYVAVRGYYPAKFLRPWEIDDELYSDLNKDEPWWGFEFETGYLNNDLRAEVIRETWDTMDNMCFDGEGEGASRVEITFAPQERSKFEDRTAEACKFMRLLDSKRDTHVMKTEATAVGCHLNVSVPGLNKDNYGAVTAIMNNTINLLHPVLPGTDRNTKLEFFGREQLYGLFYAQQSPPTYNDNGQIDHSVPQMYWLEGKLFRTSYHYARFEQYLAVCDAITRCMEWLVKQDIKVLNKADNRATTRMQPVPGAAYDDNTGYYESYEPVGKKGAYFKNFIAMVLEGADPEIANWNDNPGLLEDGSDCLVKKFRCTAAPAEEAAAPAEVEEVAVAPAEAA